MAAKAEAVDATRRSKEGKQRRFIIVYAEPDTTIENEQSSLGRPPDKFYEQLSK